MNRILPLVVVGLLIAVGASAVTALLISQIRSTNTTTGSVAVTPPGSATPVWGVPGTGISISAAGVVSASGAVGPTGPAGPAGPTGATGPAATLATPVVGEIPTGTINGVNPTFTLANTPNTSYPLTVWLGGQHLFTTNGDFTIAGNTLTFTGIIPPAGANLNVDYWH
jgi:hypothetical protein